MKPDQDRSLYEPYLIIVAVVFFASVRVHYTEHMRVVVALRILCEAYIILCVTFMAMYLKEWAEVFTEVYLGRYTESEVCELKKAAKNSLFMYNSCLGFGFICGLVYFTSFLF